MCQMVVVRPRPPKICFALPPRPHNLWLVQRQRPLHASCDAVGQPIEHNVYWDGFLQSLLANVNIAHKRKRGRS